MQREIPEKINIEGAKLAKELGLLVILDAGGEDKPISKDLLQYVDIISPNEVTFINFRLNFIELLINTQIFIQIKMSLNHLNN